MSGRNLSPLDAILADLQHGMDALAPKSVDDKYPAKSDMPELSAQERQHAAGLMRVNHAGEVAAQALYRGQARVARNAQTRQHLLEAASEEQDHLDWCAKRLEELGSKPSQLSPFWYAGSYAIGAVAGLAGDRWSLGFVSETEKQVEEHLQGHLEKLPADDTRSRDIVQQMKEDEARHGEQARQAGGQELPPPLRGLMRAAAKVMTTAAYKG